MLQNMRYNPQIGHAKAGSEHIVGNSPVLAREATGGACKQRHLAAAAVCEGPLTAGPRTLIVILRAWVKAQKKRQAKHASNVDIPSTGVKRGHG